MYLCVLESYACGSEIIVFWKGIVVKVQIIFAEMEMGHGLYKINKSGSGAAD